MQNLLHNRLQSQLLLSEKELLKFQICWVWLLSNLKTKKTRVSSFLGKANPFWVKERHLVRMQQGEIGVASPIPFVLRNDSLGWWFTPNCSWQWKKLQYSVLLFRVEQVFKRVPSWSRWIILQSEVDSYTVGITLVNQPSPAVPHLSDVCVLGLFNYLGVSDFSHNRH